MVLSSRFSSRSSPGSPGSHSRGARLVLVAKRGLPRPPPAADCDGDLFAVFLHVGDEFAGGAVGDHGSDRNLQDDVLRLAAVHVGAFALLAVSGLVMAVVNQADQALFAVGRFEDHIAAGTAVAAVRTAARHEFLPVETAAAVAAVTGFDRDGRFVYKHFMTPQIKLVMTSASQY